MKRKALSLAVAVVVGAASLSAQNPQQNPRDQRTGGESTAHAPAPDPVAADPRQFVEQLGVAGLTEIRLGTIAAERAVSADVKAFGQMMVRDHTEGVKGLAAAASKMNLEMPKAPDETHQQLIDRLAALPGQSFDREYMTAMVKAHEEVLTKVRARAGRQYTTATPASPERVDTGANPSPVAGNTGAEPKDRRVGTSGSGGEDALTAWAAKALPTVQHHLEEARKLAQAAK